jgi:hypothetical protein
LVNNTDNGLSGYFNDYEDRRVFRRTRLRTEQIFSGLGNTISAFEKTAMLAGNPEPQFVTFFVPAPRHRRKTPCVAICWRRTECGCRQERHA